MNGKPASNLGSRRVWRLTCMAGVVFAMAACGSSSGSGPSASTSTSSSSTSARTTLYQRVLGFSQCMRSHGVPDFPDPGANGAISLGGAANQINLANSVVKAAALDCRHLLPNGGTLNPTQQQKVLNALLQFAQCMRSHGVPNFPDPSLVNGSVSLNLQGTGISYTTPHVATAVAFCRAALAKKAGT
jgi:hypothetical protein